MAPGVLSLLTLVWTDLLVLPVFLRSIVEDPGSAGVVLLVGLVALVCAAFVGALAGLAGKPRPSGQFAAGLYWIGWICLVLVGGMGD